ncbi:DnaJ-domain-containing protein [Desarmillaria tabescens]|uniref:DnaJ-domain-containing protein n=1 Tax=Armillaria tabescens TaxID=1929756 RepID=A0AA39TW73_ARMTA|nr:DnaJ-domain-containing protein [Desarmillaria tabescens]KAK0468238.1 DnaJ-domain-containing protein [Desarmillaria tabescens]
MRFALFLACLFVLVTTVVAWEKEDHEIFDLVSAVEASEGKGTTFYSWLDVPHTATTTEIAKAYRKMSMQLHPDKNPKDKKIHERFARLGVVSTILRNPESRKRYDFFYKNGVPKWRGTGYYYSRFRPGLGSVLVFLTVLTSSLQYIIQKMNYKRDLERIERIRQDARLAAWGPKMIPVEGQRKVKVNLSGGGPRYDGDGNPLQVRGRTIDMVVEGMNVYILDPSGDMELLDSSAATSPHIMRTWFLTLVCGAYNKVVARSSTDANDTPGDSANEGYSVDDDDSESGGSGTVTPSNGNAKYGPVSKAGGRRRRATKKSSAKR